MKLNKRQLADYRRLRDKGLSRSEARRIAKMTTDQLADAILRRLRAAAIRGMS